MRTNITTYFIVSLLFASVLVSCEKPQIEPEQEDLAIKWDIHSSKDRDLATKSLIYTDNDLQHHCTSVADGGLGEGIGFWADIHELEGNNIVTYQNVFGAAQTRLIYYPNSLETVKWDYDATALFWSIGSKYVVRAFYPQSMNTNIIHASTNADLFVLEYNSHAIQEDLMVAYNEVHTLDPVSDAPSVAIRVAESSPGHYGEVLSMDTGMGTGTNPDWRGYTQPFDLNDPIPLYFRHTMAAVRVRFTFSYDDTDELTSCNFSNLRNDRGLLTVGVLLYGKYDPTAPNILDYRRNFKWISYQTSFDEIPFYTWEVQDGAPGSLITRTTSGTTINERMAIAYSARDNHILRRSNDSNLNNVVDASEIVSETQVDGTTPLPVKKKVAPFYNENDGWLLIVPQELKEGVQLEFSTKKLGKKKVALPPFTGTLSNGNQSSTNPNANFFVPGYRYTYTVVIKHADLEVVTTVEPWEDIYSTHEIILN